MPTESKAQTDWTPDLFSWWNSSVAQNRADGHEQQTAHHRWCNSRRCWWQKCSMRNRLTVVKFPNRKTQPGFLSSFRIQIQNTFSPWDFEVFWKGWRHVSWMGGLVRSDLFSSIGNDAIMRDMFTLPPHSQLNACVSTIRAAPPSP